MKRIYPYLQGNLLRLRVAVGGKTIRAVNLGAGQIVLIEKDNGKMSVKLDTVPVSGQWDGLLVVSERRDRDGSPPGGRDRNRDALMEGAPPEGYEDPPF
ncbi:hypothetical protein DBT_1826 [Dissulfuribacter thermophilus]|uniref:Uncharacterized protein n=1 Tax=Dissulfuribacter thermophilus TaxID=1156395 RepID=A0A1B9F4A9_9BACT|nr:hypothetical protein [Dissulfuribacter thermophilus]OCC14766.1 hypothetical protein DBT_1826 [Dissulfuribacter thermophilus]